MKHIISCALFVIAATHFTFGQPKATSPQLPPPKQALVTWDDYNPVFQHLEAAVYELKTSAAKGSQINPLLEDIEQDWRFLKFQWLGEIGASPSPADYKTSLDVDNDLLWEAKGLGLSNKKAQALLQDVRDDLRVKAEDCRKAPHTWDKLIEFTVETRREMLPISGYEVWIVAKGWADKPDKWTRFSKLSSPTAIILPPGRYMVRLKKESTTAPEPVTVRNEGEFKQKYDMRLP